MATSPISSIKLSWKGIQRGILAIFTGISLGLIGILFHNSYSPLGLIIALFEGGIGFFYFGKQIPGKIIHLLLFLSWLTIVYKSASFGVSQEVLIEGNLNGFIFLLGGMFINFLGLLLAKRIK